MGRINNGYYRPRWEEFIRDVYRALEQGKEFDQKAFNKKMIEWEQDFVDNDFISADTPRKDGAKIARHIKNKYKLSVLKNIQ